MHAQLACKNVIIYRRKPYMYKISDRTMLINFIPSFIAGIFRGYKLKSAKTVNILYPRNIPAASLHAKQKAAHEI